MIAKMIMALCLALVAEQTSMGNVITAKNVSLCSDNEIYKYWLAKKGTFFLYKKGIIQDKVIYLTFDDGPNPYATLEILNVLDKYNIKATFFLIGKNIKKYPQIVKEISRRGHIIGNHTFSHNMFFLFSSVTLQKKEAQRVEDILRELRIKNCSYFRPPNAVCSKNIISAMRNYKIVGVNHWISDNTIFSYKLISAKAFNSIKKRGGGIMVLHDGTHPVLALTRRILPRALDVLIPRLLAEGYQFRNLDSIQASNVVIVPLGECSN